MAEANLKRDIEQAWRFYGYAMPYWKQIVAAMVAMVFATALSANIMVLLKPAIDVLQARERQTDIVAESAEQQRPVDPVTSAKKRFQDWFTNLPGISHARQWLYSGNTLARIAFVFAVGIAPLLVVSNFTYQYIHRRVVWRIMADLRASVFDRLCSLSLQYYARHRTGELVSRLTNDISATQQALKLIFGKLLKAPLMLVVFLGLAVWFSWHLTLVALVCLPVMALLQGRYGGRLRRHSQKNLARLGDVTDAITQMLQGVREVKTFQGEKREGTRFRDYTRQQLRRAFKLVRTRAWADALPDLLLAEMTAFTVWLAGWLVSTGRLDVTSLFLCVGCLALTSTPIRHLVKSYNGLQESMGGVKRLFELLDTASEIQEAPDAIVLTDVRKEVQFDGVWFAYDDEPVLRDISLTVPCGKTYAIVGETGAGKSTLLDLIPRFYDVDRGAVKVDGVDVRRFTLESLRNHVAIVGQHPFLFNRTVAENIRYGKPNADDSQVIAAARAANVHEFITRLPEGYETMAGERGGRFSGGQRQCITIARAILKNAPILILDEATSNLDAESELLVQRALQNLMEGRTTLVIAHRLSTVRHADQIVVLKAGRVIEMGTHDGLLDRGGEYERLYRMQFLETPDGPVQAPPPDPTHTERETE